MRIDKSGIPEDKLADPRLVEWEEAVLKAMADEHYALRALLHEAAHELYAKRAGASGVVFHGPIIFYERETDEFECGNAGFEAVFDGVDIDFLAVARWSAAGGVASRLLAGVEPGDERDYEIFKSFAGDFAEADLLNLWEAAKRDVERDLRSPKLRRQLWERARELWEELGERMRD